MSDFLDEEYIQEVLASTPGKDSSGYDVMRTIMIGESVKRIIFGVFKVIGGVLWIQWNNGDKEKVDMRSDDL